MNRPGFLLVLEGIDGAGKSSLARQLAAWCRERGLQVVTSREPTDGPYGTALRRSAKTGRLAPEGELELFLKDRAEHVEKLIRPALAQGDMVILDRYYFSTAAYQGARGLDAKTILTANEAFAPAPDLVLLLDLDPRAGTGRIVSRGDRPDEFEALAYLAEVRAIFLSLRQPCIRRVNADQPAEAVLATCTTLLAEALEQSGIWAEPLSRLDFLSGAGDTVRDPHLG